MRRVVAVVIEPRLAHGNRTIVREQLAKLVQPLRVGRICIVGMDAERGVHARLLPGKRERRPARLDARADGDDTLDPRRARALQHRAAGSAQASRCACVSIKRPRRARRAGRAAAPARCRSQARAHPSARRPMQRPRSGRAHAGSRGGRRQVRVERDRDGTDPVREVVEHRVELGRLVVVLRQLPGLRALDEPVELPHDFPDRLERARELPGVEPSRDLVVQRVELGGDLRRSRARSAARRRGSWRSSPSFSTRGCRARSRAPAHSARGARPRRPHRRVRTSPSGSPSSAPDRSRTHRPAGAGR